MSRRDELGAGWVHVVLVERRQDRHGNLHIWIEGVAQTRVGAMQLIGLAREDDDLKKLRTLIDGAMQGGAWSAQERADDNSDAWEVAFQIFPFEVQRA